MATDSIIPPVDADAKVLRSPKDLKAVLAKTLSELHLALHIAEPNLENFTFLNSGGSGLIETAVDKALGRIIAVKSLLPDTRHSREAIERLVREAIATAALEHPNIVPLHTIGACPERGVYFTMKRLRGDSLRSIITQLAHYNPAYTSV
jgi:serine/threonine protein kinase